MLSLDEACKVLKERGLPIDVKTLRNLTYRFAQYARTALQTGAMEFVDNVAGRRIVVSVDGDGYVFAKTNRVQRLKKVALVTKQTGGSPSY